MILQGSLSQIRQKQPLVNAITNYITINDCANIALAVGASPAMCESQDEVWDFTPLASSLYINIGTLTREQRNSINLAVERASELSIPIILDPVGSVALKSRQSLVKTLLTNYKITCLKGNIAEIKLLSGRYALAQGVDSLDTGEEVLEASQELADQYNTVVIATGPHDYITNGSETYRISNGTPLLGQITGAGCMLGMVTAGFLGSDLDKLHGCLTATTAMGIAGELARECIEHPTDLGSFRVKLFDEMAGLTEEKLIKRGDIYEL